MQFTQGGNIARLLVLMHHPLNDGNGDTAKCDQRGDGCENDGKIGFHFKQNEQSIEGQQRICRAFCKQNNMNIVEEYIDRAVSASKHTERRENFQRMIKDSDKRHFDAVVVYKLDRFARDRYDSAIYKNRLKRNDVRVISATENITDSPEGIILESVLEGMAEFYSKELAQKVTRGMNETALKCNSCGGHIPLGYKIENKKFVVDPTTAPIVVEAFEMYANGATVAEICENFNNRGFKTAKGAEFNKNSFRSMFQNERYIGVYKYKDVRIEGGVPAIVDREIFETVQRRLKINAQAPSRGKAKVEYLLAQKLFCGHCGSPMTGESGTSKSGTAYNYYTCAGRKRFHSCDKKNLRKEWIETVVVRDALAILTPEHIEELADIAVSQAEAEAAENALIPALQAEIHDTERSIANLLKLVERGSDSASLFDRLNELESQKKHLEGRLKEELKTVLILEKEQVIWWFNQFTKGDIDDPDFRRQVIDMLVNSVTVWDEPDGWYKITAVYNLTSQNSIYLSFHMFFPLQVQQWNHCSTKMPSAYQLQLTACTYLWRKPPCYQQFPYTGYRMS